MWSFNFQDCFCTNDKVCAYVFLMYLYAFLNISCNIWKMHCNKEISIVHLIYCAFHWSNFMFHFFFTCQYVCWVWTISPISVTGILSIFCIMNKVTGVENVRCLSDVLFLLSEMYALVCQSILNVLPVSQQIGPLRLFLQARRCSEKSFQ